MLVERFTCYHRRSYVCKTGLGDVLIGAAATIADYNGIPKVSHIKDKLIEMTHLNETIFAAGIASSHQGHKMKSGVYLNEDMLAQVCKHNVTRLPYEIARLAQDIAGGLVVTLPSEKDFRHPEAGPLLASSHQGHKMKSGVYLNEDMLAQVCKHNVTRLPYEIARLAQDIAGGLVVTLPSEKDFRHPEAGPLLKKYLAGRKGADVENRMRILRLIENMTLGRNAVGYLTESMHGAGSPQAQRIQIQRQMQVGYKKNLAKHLAGITNDIEEPKELSDYFKRVFKTKDSVL